MVCRRKSVLTLAPAGPGAPASPGTPCQEDLKKSHSLSGVPWLIKSMANGRSTWVAMWVTMECSASWLRVELYGVLVHSYPK